ncbi:MAG: hypothetical protein K0S33_3425 [Bacteroidetes bacterium]|jgi:hypothetical protein|nr:hypothetical protein [Bacteroidota bacterium]
MALYALYGSNTKIHMVIKAPHNIPESTEKKHVFLAGSIEMGKAENWQKTVEDAFASREDVVLLNPRRVDWDSSWEQKKENVQFAEQVNWELNAMERADLIIMYFSPETKAPVTLLEFGLHARSGKLVVCCPEGFWRKGNVDIVCDKYGIEQIDSLTQIIERIQTKTQQL